METAVDQQEEVGQTKPMAMNWVRALYQRLGMTQETCAPELDMLRHDFNRMINKSGSIRLDRLARLLKLAQQKGKAELLRTAESIIEEYLE